MALGVDKPRNLLSYDELKSLEVEVSCLLPFQDYRLVPFPPSLLALLVILSISLLCRLERPFIVRAYWTVPKAIVFVFLLNEALSMSVSNGCATPTWALTSIS
jgi:hypothetical protein